VITELKSLMIPKIIQDNGVLILTVNLQNLMEYI
jgi:hypothetical protein